jgi:hypothetical protein
MLVEYTLIFKTLETHFIMVVIFNARIKKNIRMLKNVLHIIMVAMATYFPHQIFVKKEKFSNQVHS